MCVFERVGGQYHLLEVVIFYKLLKLLYVANRHQVLLHMGKGHEVICKWREKQGQRKREGRRRTTKAGRNMAGGRKWACVCLFVSMRE